MPRLDLNLWLSCLSLSECWSILFLALYPHINSLNWIIEQPTGCFLIQLDLNTVYLGFSCFLEWLIGHRKQLYVAVIVKDSTKAMDGQPMHKPRSGQMARSCHVLCCIYPPWHFHKHHVPDALQTQFGNFYGRFISNNDKLLTAFLVSPHLWRGETESSELLMSWSFHSDQFLL